MKRVLVTGSGGFVGSALVAALRERGHSVIALRRGSATCTDGDEIQDDLTRPNCLDALADAGNRPDTVVHLAGRIEIALTPGANGPVAGRQDIPEIYRQNVQATANLLAWCLRVGVGHIVFASSQAVYGVPAEIPLTERSPLAPLEQYAASKVCCEQMLRTASGPHLSVTSLRFPGVYAESRPQGVVYNLCRRAVEERRIEVLADFPLPLDVIHRDDVVDGFVRSVEWGGSGWVCLNLATGEPCNLNLLAEDVAALVPGCRVSHAGCPQPIVQMDTQAAWQRLRWKALPRRERLATLVRGITDAG